MGEKVRAVHLLPARHTVTGMDIADEAEFEALLTANQEPHLDLPPAAHGTDAQRRSQIVKQGAPAALLVKAH